MSQTYYSPSHEYVRIEGDIAVIGITNYAQSQLGDIVFVDHNRTPKENDIVCLSLRDEENFTAKTIFRLYVPSGSVTACITATNDPSIQNKVIFVDGINVKIYGVVEKILRNL